MNDAFFAILEQAFNETLENVAFMFAEPLDEASDGGGQPLLKADISFDGPESGTLSVTLPETMAAELAANSLGVEPDDEEAVSQGKDAVGEMLNVFCGKLLTNWKGEDPIFNLSIPVIKSLDASEWSRLCDMDNSVLFRVEDYPVLVIANCGNNAN